MSAGGWFVPAFLPDRRDGPAPAAGGRGFPVAYRKDAFVAADFPLRAKFARLTQQEERQGLLRDTAGIGARSGWKRRLLAAGLMSRDIG
jgi:hypothetical protein